MTETAHLARAFLDVPLAAARDGLRQTARALGVPVDETGEHLVVRLRTGMLRVSVVAGRTGLEIAAGEAAGLQLLRDMVAERVGGMGFRLDWQDGAGGRRPGNMSLARVESVARISPSYVRLVVAGPDLARFGRGGLHFRLLLGPQGSDWPMTDEGGVTCWPAGIAAWHRPVYTTRAIEPLGGGAARIGFDVFLHAGGRASAWAERAQPGDEVAMTGPSGGERPAAGWMGLVGDETAVPVLARILAEAAPATRGAAVLFVPEAGDVQSLAHPSGVAVRWALRGGGEAPLDALDALRPPAGDRFVFFAAERQEALAARDRLQAQGFARGSFHASAYWTAGT